MICVHSSSVYWQTMFKLIWKSCRNFLKMKSENIFVIESQSKKIKWWRDNCYVENKTLLNYDITQMMRRSRLSFLKNCCRVDSWALTIFNSTMNLSISNREMIKKCKLFDCWWFAENEWLKHSLFERECDTAKNKRVDNTYIYFNCIAWCSDRRL